MTLTIELKTEIITNTHAEYIRIMFGNKGVNFLMANKFLRVTHIISISNMIMYNFHTMTITDVDCVDCVTHYCLPSMLH